MTTPDPALPDQTNPALRTVKMAKLNVQLSQKTDEFSKLNGIYPFACRSTCLGIAFSAKSHGYHENTIVNEILWVYSPDSGWSGLAKNDCKIFADLTHWERFDKVNGAQPYNINAPHFILQFEARHSFCWTFLNFTCDLTPKRSRLITNFLGRSLKFIEETHVVSLVLIRCWKSVAKSQEVSSFHVGFHSFISILCKTTSHTSCLNN